MTFITSFSRHKSSEEQTPLSPKNDVDLSNIYPSLRSTVYVGQENRERSGYYEKLKPVPPQKILEYLSKILDIPENEHRLTLNV